MEIVSVDPFQCVRWKLADRSGFEFGDIYALSQDILKHGQIEPALIRRSPDKEHQYEVIAGSRRWKACREANIPLKAIVQDLSDQEAAVAQIKENQQLSLCDYSKGIYYAKILKEKAMTQTQLAEAIGCSRAKLENFLAFDKVPSSIWNAVGNLSKVSSRTASVIYVLSKKGSAYEDALIELADDIRKGIGCTALEKKVIALGEGESQIIDISNQIALPSGKTIASWTKQGLQFSKDVSIDQKEISLLLIRHFQKQFG